MSTELRDPELVAGMVDELMTGVEELHAEHRQTLADKEELLVALEEVLQGMERRTWFDTAARAAPIRRLIAKHRGGVVLGVVTQ